MPPTFTSILFSVTEACHVGCSHCGFIGSTRDRDVDANELREWVANACAYGIPKIIFTGGEPFERFEVLRDAVATAAAWSVEIGVFTSSFWGSSFDAAATLLDKLSGLTHLYLSSDRFHQRRVPLAFVCNVIDAALKREIKDISICITYTHEEERLETQQQFASYGERLMFHFDRVIPTQFLSPIVLKNQSRGIGTAPSEYGCSCYLGTPIVNPNGDVFSCHAGKAAAHADMQTLPYYLGNLRGASFEALMRMSERRWDYQFLRTHGPKGVAQLFSIYPDLASAVGRQEFTNGCDMCFSVLRNREGRAALGHHVSKASVQDSINQRLVISLGEEPIEGEGPNSTKGEANATKRKECYPNGCA
ncbi:MAG: radical SAM protein [Acidobacteriota bacterium]|nr:radical SAM protein [Acidobacteriota bacterium]